MRMPKHWALILAGCAIAAIALERALVVSEPRPRLLAASEADSRFCAPARPPPLQEGGAPSVTQPGGIDPLGVSQAIRSALDDCPR